MKNNIHTTPDHPNRKKNRLTDYDYSSCGAYFITICAVKQRNLFWKNPRAIAAHPGDAELSPYGETLDRAINNISSVYPAAEVKSYVIMPNHVHILLVICADNESERLPYRPTVSRIVNQLKGYVSRQIGATIWQKSFYDHIIRNRKDYEEHLRYIYENPMRLYYDELYREK